MGDNEDTVVEDTARVHGNVKIGKGCYILFGAVIRADGGAKCVIGDGCNVQDNAVLHGDPGFDTVLENGVSVGHGAVVHGCRIGENTIVGMKSVVLNGAVVGKGCLIGAGAVIGEGKIIPDYSLVVGVPGKVIRTDPSYEQRGIMNAQAYQELRKARLQQKRTSKL